LIAIYLVYRSDLSYYGGDLKQMLAALTAKTEKKQNLSSSKINSCSNMVSCLRSMGKNLIDWKKIVGTEEEVYHTMNVKGPSIKEEG